MAGKHAAEERRSVGWRGVLGVVIAAVVTVAAVFGVRALSDPAPAAESTPCPKKLQLQVAAAPEMVAPLDAMAAKLSTGAIKVRGECVILAVKATDSFEMYTKLSAKNSSGNPDLWIPSGQEWVTRTGIPVNRVRLIDSAVATSPLVLATTRTTAEKLRQDKATTDWRRLATSGRMALGDAEKSGVALSALLALQRSKADVKSALVDLLRERVPDLDGEFFRTAKISSETSTDRIDRGVPSTEQQVLAYLRRESTADLVALTPQSGTVLRDYPLVAVVHNKSQVPRLLEASAALKKYLAGKDAKALLQKAGFRDPANLASFDTQSDGAGKVRVLGAGQPGDADVALRTWATMSLSSRVLVAADVSSSMWSRVGRGNGVTAGRDLSKKLVGYFPDDSQFGLWAFSFDQQKKTSFSKTAPLRALDDRQRALLTKAMKDLPARKDRLVGSLRPTLLEAYREVQRGASGSRKSSLVLVTDGQDDGASAQKPATDQELAKAVKKLAKADKPVSIILVGAGADVDMKRLGALAKALGGKAIRAQDAIALRDLTLL